MERPLGTVILGAGFVGRLHARAARLAGARLLGVATSSLASAREAAVELGAEQAFASADEALAHPEADVVHVCTPNHLHEPLARRALEAGRDVVCEKPVALDAAGAARVGDAAVAAGRLLAVPFAYRFHPIVREARALVRDGELGPVQLIHGQYTQDWLAGTDDTNWRVAAASGGPSRAFADIGSHWCDLAEFVTGHRITRVVAKLATFIPERPARTVPAFGGGGGARGAGGPRGGRRAVDTEDAATALFETDGGAHGAVVVSQVSPGRKNRLVLEVAGAEASLAFDQERAEQLWLGRREATTIVLRDPSHNAPDAARLSFLPAGHAQGYGDCIALFVADAYAAIRAGRVPEGLPTAADGLRAAQVVDAVLASAGSGTWANVPPAPGPS